MKKLYLFCWLILLQQLLFAQARVTRFYSDYNGFYTSASNQINPILPDNSHNLLAFTYNNITYSTGVDDAKLTAQGVSFTPQTFRAIPLNNVPTSGPSYFVALGQLYDGINAGVNNSSSAPFQGNPISGATLASFLTDGINGLDLGTGLANIPAGSVLQFNLGASGISATSIGDGIPDILFVQIADPNNVGDKIKFVNSSGATVGTEFTFNLYSTINFPRLANWRADFYNPNSTQNSSSFINTARYISMLALDLSQLGITTANYASVTQLVYTTSGQSDPAFVAFNEPSVSLPSKLGVHSQPTIYQTNIAMNPEFQVRLLNSFNQPVLQANVAITATVETGNGQLAGTITRYTDANGIAYFNDLTLSGNNTHTLRFSSSSLNPAISGPVIWSSLLPVRWAAFNGTLKESAVHLSWATNQELSTLDFVIERSTNGQQWTSLGKVTAAGNSSILRTYGFVDRNPVKGTSYYRVTQQDLDGRQSRTEAIRIQNNQAGTNCKLLANPLIAKQLQVEIKFSTSIELFSSMGIQLLHKELAPGRHTISLDRYAAGMYYLRTPEKTYPILVQ
ncbi:hypothetical protein [Flavihumibacter sp. CACIAM 22H1]|uniref:hypothetical protein n=1 Tax=Flavihumibacter sp. CACIAM 22H1 TaxID=1812911 RepID=UPI000B069166|nr:hypothetical protein [Flavihumibacter sp. CACIAM 22H1]